MNPGPTNFAKVTTVFLRLDILDLKEEEVVVIVVGGEGDGEGAVQRRWWRERIRGRASPSGLGRVVLLVLLGVGSSAVLMTGVETAGLPPPGSSGTAVLAIVAYLCSVRDCCRGMMVRDGSYYRPSSSSAFAMSHSTIVQRQRQQTKSAPS